jgi:D-alanyl-D-alanine dipeptidase
LTPRKPSILEPVSQLRRVRIVECGEPLVEFLRVCPDLHMLPSRFRYRREVMLRESVANMLCRANALLPKGYRLGIIEGWRAPHIQQRLYLWSWNRFRDRHPDWSEVKLKRTVNRFTAPMNQRVPPPHTTGGAVDLLLADREGKALDHLSPYERFDPRGYPMDAPNLTEEARRHRQILADVLNEVGLTNYPSEYWHWSYGDQGWAYRGHHSHAIYGAIQPDDWQPDPADLAEGPLELAPD